MTPGPWRIMEIGEYESQEYYIVNDKDVVVVAGQGDCCKTGGIRTEPNARAIAAVPSMIAAVVISDDAHRFWDAYERRMTPKFSAAVIMDAIIKKYPDIEWECTQFGVSKRHPELDGHYYLWGKELQKRAAETRTAALGKALAAAPEVAK